MNRRNIMRNRVKRAMSALLVAALTITVFAAAPPAKSGTRTDEGISVYADEAIATWIKNYGGSDDDSFDAVVPSADGGYVAVGGSYSPDGGLEKWIMAIAKFDGNGNRLWMKNYDRVGVGALNSLAQASDGGYVAAGFGLLLGDGGGFRSLLVKFDESGNQVWEKNYDEIDMFNSLIPAQGGGYIAAVNPSSEQESMAIAKFDESGNMLWKESCGEVGDGGYFYDVAQAPGGGYVAVGSFNALAKNNNVPKDQPHYANALIAKFDGSGNQIWMNNYDGGLEGGLYSVVPAAGGGYVAVGCYGLSGTGETGISNNMSISKFDELGNMVWTKNCGGSRDDAFYSVTQAQGGGYIAVGDSSSSDGDMPGCRGGYDMAIARFDENGNKVWMKNYGGSEEDSFSAVIHAASGSYVAVGSSLSSDGNLPGNNGGTDMIIAKFDESGNLTSGSGTNSGGDEQNGHVTAPPPQPSAGATPTQTAQDTTVTAPAKISVAKLAAGKGQVKITWKKSPAAQKVAGYEIRYKEKNAKKWKVKTAKAKATSLTIKKLKKGKVYQIQIRSYKVAGGKKYYAPWSATKTSKKVK